MDAVNGKIWFRQGSLLGMFDPVTFYYYNIPEKVDVPVNLSLSGILVDKGTYTTEELTFDSEKNSFEQV